jgi:hypothetical protein
MAWIGWILAVAAIGAMVWLWRELRIERAHGSELLCSKMEVENQLDVLRGEHGANVDAGVEANASLAAIGTQLGEPLESVRSHLQRTGTQLDDYRERVKRFDEAVQYCLQPVELIFGADKATLTELMRHVEGARRKLFETRGALEKNPLHHGAGALAVGLGALEDLVAYVRGLRSPPARRVAAEVPDPVLEAEAEAETALPPRPDHGNPMLP